MSVPFSDPDRVHIFDTTLRDGEQSPGASMNLEEKLRIAKVLEEMGVDVIEAGFPVASRGDFEAVYEIARIVRSATVCGLSRAVRGDIELAAQAIKPAQRGRIHTFISTSPLHMKYKLQLDPYQVYNRVIESVRLARCFTDDVEWSCEDGSRSDHDFLCRCVEAAIDAGASTINIPDTVGYAVPDEFAAIITMLRNRVPNIDRAVISVHCHNDLGLAVANSLAAVRAGARQVECTINGIGERAGNAAMEEIVMALRTRGDRLPFTTGIRTEAITRASRLVSAITGFVVQPNKAIVGANAFTHESGIHAHGMRRDVRTYEVMEPRHVGAESRITLGKHSGKDALSQRLSELGFKVDDTTLQEVYIRFKKIADQKKGMLYDDDLLAAYDEAMARAHTRIKLVSHRVVSGARRAHANIKLCLDGRAYTARCYGDGPIHAAFKAIDRMLADRLIKKVELTHYRVDAVTPGSDAQGSVHVRVRVNGAQCTGVGTDPDTVVASIRAYLQALGRAMTYLEGCAEQEQKIEKPGQNPVM